MQSSSLPMGNRSGGMLMINKQLLERRFSKRADTYDEFATVQKKMANKLLSLLQKELSNEQPLRILEIGSGTGYVTKALLAKFPKANITAIELAEGMIAKAKQHISSQRVQFICAILSRIRYKKRMM